MINVLTIQLLHIKQTNKTNKMTIKTTIRKIMAGAMLAGMNLASSAGIVPEMSSARMRFESGDNSAMTKTVTTALGNSNGEFARMYNNIGTKGDYTTAGATIQGITPFVAVGDTEGAGIEVRKTFGDTIIDFGSEHAGGSKDITRIGGQVDQRFGKFMVGVAYDNVENKTGTNDVSRDYGLVRVVYDNGKDQVGVGFRRTNETEDNSAIAHYMHYGPKENFSTRTWVKADWNDKTSSSTISFDSINVIGTSTFKPTHGPWLEENSSVDGGMYNVSALANPLSVERVPIENRAVNGFVSDLSGTITDNAKGQTQCVKAEAGYVAKVSSALTAGATLSYAHNFDDKDKDRIGATVQIGFNALGGRVVLEQIANQAVSKTVSPSGNQRVETYSSISYNKNF
jgi:hypothetical protein